MEITKCTQKWEKYQKRYFAWHCQKYFKNNDTPHVLPKLVKLFEGGILSEAIEIVQ